MSDALFSLVNARQPVPQKSNFEDTKQYKREAYEHDDDYDQKDDVSLNDTDGHNGKMSAHEKPTDFLALMLSQIEPGTQNQSQTDVTDFSEMTIDMNNGTPVISNAPLAQAGIQAGLVIAQEAINQNGNTIGLITPTANVDASLVTVTPVDAKLNNNAPLINSAQNAIVKDGVNKASIAQTQNNTAPDMFAKIVNGETPILDADGQSYEWRTSVQGTGNNSAQNGNSLITAQLFGGTDSGLNSAASMVATIAQNSANTTQQSLSGTDLAMIASADGISLDGFEMSNGGDFSQGFNDSDAETLFMTKDLAANRATASGTPTAAQSFANTLTQAKAQGHVNAPSEQVMMQLQKGAEGKLEKISIQLDPASLGKVDIEFDVAEDGRVKAIIRAERPETLELLKQDSSTIENLLAEAGLETAEDGLAFDLRQQNDEGRETDKNKNNETFSLEDETMTSAVETQDIQMQASAMGVLTATQVNILV